MESRRATNVLLMLIFFALVALLFTRAPIHQAEAETFRLDSCITAGAYDKPEAYLHVITHDVSPIQSSSKLR